MLIARMTIGMCFVFSLVSGHELTGLTGDHSDGHLNQKLMNARKSQSKDVFHKDVVVFIGDRVISQFVDGGLWKTGVTLVNLENHPVSFQVLFFQDNGTDLYVPVTGQGLVRGMNILLNTAGSATFETAGTSANLFQGWALLSQDTTDSIGGFAIFRQSIAGGQPQEAVVPIVNQFESHFVLPFDNTAYVTAAAIANPTLQAVIIPVTIRNEQGQIIDRQTISLGAYGHAAFPLANQWPSTARIRGAIEFQTSGFGVGALGLRFNGSAFTTFNVLENFNWVVN